MPRKFLVKHASYSTKQRMKEIQFWFIVRQLSQKYKKRIVIAKDHQYYLENIIENFCEANELKTTSIKYAMAKANHQYYKPTHLEVALATKYLDIPVRIAFQLSNISNRKMYAALETYIKKENSYDLEPRFDLEITIELEKFNRAFHQMFGRSQYVSNITEEVYEESVDPYDEWTWDKLY